MAVVVSHLLIKALRICREVTESANQFAAGLKDVVVHNLTH